MIRKLLALSIFSVALSTSVQAQKLTLDNLIAIRNGTISDTNDALLPKGWKFKGAETKPYVDGDCGYQQIVWAFDRTADSETAESFLNYYKGNGCSNFVGYVACDVEAFNAIKATVKRYGMKLTDEEVDIDKDDGSPYTLSTYEGAKYRVTLTVTNIAKIGNGPTNLYQVGVYLKDN